MVILTKLIVLITLFVFSNNLEVDASAESINHSVTNRLDNLEARVNTENNEVKSEIYSLEKSIISLNSSENVPNEERCSLLEATGVEPARTRKTIKQFEDELSALERDKLALVFEIKKAKREFRKKIRTWGDSIGFVTSQMDSLQLKQDNLKTLLKKYEHIVINECKNVNDAEERKHEMSEDFPFLNETVRDKYPTRTPCVDGWLLFDKHCYYYESQERTFSSARDYCRKSNAYIAEVERRSESKFIYRLTGDRYTWIGVNDEKEENVWISERTGQPVSYMNWLRGDPDGGRNQNCVILGYRRHKYHKWIDAPCSRPYHFVCKKEAFPVK